MADTDEARRALRQARVAVQSVSWDIDNPTLTENSRFRLLWKLGFELHQMLEEYRIPKEAHDEKED